ncbi:MAG TPA: sulfur transferase domain-containing protein, partial [Gemmataceae bacterium]
MRRLGLVTLLAAVGCRENPEPPPAGPPPGAAKAAEIRPLEVPGLHNVFRVSDRLYSGSSPEGDEGFAALRELGVRTVISVDGARPDVGAARRHGLTYVHLPFGYDGIPRERVLALAKAAATLPGPVYVHCHHGKHRGPAAVAVIQLCNDPAWDADTAASWMEMAGTDPRYTGLTGLPRSLTRPTPEELARIPSGFPAVAEVPDLARLMVEVDTRWEHLRLVKAAGWAAPKGHPDIDPPHEAVQLAELYREAARLDGVNRRGQEFAELLRDGEAAARELEQVL